jgi:hypothetical protein
VSRLHRLEEYLGDAGWLLLMAFGLPLAIILVGSPIALTVRLIASLLQRL